MSFFFFFSLSLRTDGNAQLVRNVNLQQFGAALNMPYCAFHWQFRWCVAPNCVLDPFHAGQKTH